MRRLFAAAVLVAATTVLVPAAEPAPKLVVLLVVDQMRADYIERFHDDWSAGLRRLVDDGAWFTQAAYPYLSTVTCAGHATLSSGVYPHTHGIFANTWYDRKRAAVVPCTDDPQARTIAYGTQADSHTGPGNLKSPTLADQLRSGGGRVVTLALKARSAIMLAGHGGTAVTWISPALDGWETSTAYAEAPVPQVRAWVAGHPIAADYGQNWSRLLPADRYREVDAGLAEDPPKGWTATFPHALAGGGATPDTAFYDQWQHSPFADAYVARMAGAMVEAFKLGQGDRTDFLGVSFSSPDEVGHSFGPRSQEIQDMYARLDRTIGELLEQLDRSVGAGRYVVALSADHGVTDIPEQSKQAGRDAGRISASAILNAAQATAERELGRGKYLARLTGNEVYFEPGMYDLVARSPQTLQHIVDTVAAQPGVQRVFTAAELARVPTGSSDRLLRAASLSYVPGRSGDLVIAPKPGWMFSGAGTTHGSASPDDQRVPIVLFGAGIRKGRYDQPASPADVAPTLATLAGITLPKAEGRALAEALR